MEVLGKDLVEGVFYHAIPGSCRGFDDVWYRDGCSLMNPRHKNLGRHCIDVVWAYSPLTIEEVDAFTNWMTINGDEAGIAAWDKYKDKLIKETEMAKKDDTEPIKLQDFNYSKIICKWNPREIHKSLKGYICDSIDDIKLRIAINSEPDIISRTGYSRLAPPSLNGYLIHGFDAEECEVTGHYAFVLEEN